MGKDTADKAATKSFTGDIVAALLMASGTTTISMKQYELMSSLDGKKSASAFQHDFRCVLAKAKELKAQVDSGEEFKAVDGGTKKGPKRKADDTIDAPLTPPKTPKKAKAAPKPRTPAKKASAKKTMSPSPDSSELQGGENAFEEAFETFIKAEREWDDD
ncbi:hypothetical protein K491DRAFT_763591 [Lophiostoma macrostomum CBS 122681]|uniref:Uncharacterized protein n=1 Tax=Lophiostoma macrostomum CBS 122681 TaxID=1314788 RepID=A0A6A6SJN0_9PLEO|nr:hypothetical protein K491DRAFT_763591 [Lophiostoma macrostomum CBS 122681]